MILLAITMLRGDDDKAYLTRLFRKNERFMYAMAFKVVNDHCIAADVVSEAGLMMVEKIDYLRKIAPQKQTPYILAIVKNAALKYMRQKRYENERLIDDESALACAVSSQGDPVDALLVNADIRLVRQALKRLKPQERDILEMKYFSQLSDAEIAPILGISKNSVRYYLTLARRALKDEIQKEDDSYL